jgi:hypothetical protein
MLLFGPEIVEKALCLVLRNTYVINLCIIISITRIIHYEAAEPSIYSGSDNESVTADTTVPIAANVILGHTRL